MFVLKATNEAKEIKNLVAGKVRHSNFDYGLVLFQQQRRFYRPPFGFIEASKDS